MNNEFDGVWIDKSSWAYNALIGQFWEGRALHGADIVAPKVSGRGILVDPAAPTFCWHDIIGIIAPDDQGVGSTVFAAWRGGTFRVHFYGANDRADCVFHIPHDYVPGTDIYLHLHWGHNGTAISGQLVITYGVTYAKGHNQANFPAETAPVLTVSTPNIATIPQYRHRIDEIIISGPSATSTLIDRDDIEIDGLLLVGVVATTIPTITGGATNLPAFFTLDVHYQSTNIGTKQKAPNFYV